MSQFRRGSTAREVGRRRASSLPVDGFHLFLQDEWDSTKELCLDSSWNNIYMTIAAMWSTTAEEIKNRYRQKAAQSNQSALGDD
ncbi:hypothetical protein ASPWEDRAFT_43864 [Aspergillus wentii DTO 134E9]|uniref:HMG box domain-containing protein n=1 Tax=Aspergillus wentii DTO 134E9 TaxID=1073089 RepID=A0A1L9RAB7_ASPWE|nr:uncharacterized protein ASPWEDRAFT_43864 [Aspergillus wentii DTO 134E9]OJJ31861.1 hypothetical protein ASPWEDRAFT_43864 [Aspergillus wentii DTO 134E9]